MSAEGEYHIIKEAVHDSETGYAFQQSITSSNSSSADAGLESSLFQHHLFIKSTRPRYLDILENPDAFHQFLKDQISFDSNDAVPLDDSMSGAFRSKSPHYEPILGYENLNDIYDYSRKFGSEPDDISNKLSALYTAVKEWDLVQVERILDSDKFNRYLELLDDEEFGFTVTMDRDFKDKVIKKMIMEQIGSIVRPIKNDRTIKEKEINLIILLNSK